MKRPNAALWLVMYRDRCARAEKPVARVACTSRPTRDTRQRPLALGLSHRDVVGREATDILASTSYSFLYAAIGRAARVSPASSALVQYRRPCMLHPHWNSRSGREAFVEEVRRVGHRVARSLRQHLLGAEARPGRCAFFLAVDAYTYAATFSSPT